MLERIFVLETLKRPASGCWRRIIDDGDVRVGDAEFAEACHTFRTKLRTASSVHIVAESLLPGEVIGCVG